MKGFLTPEQRSELLHELKVEHHAKYSDRIETILLLDDCEKFADIAKFLFLDEGTIRNYRKRYVEGGILGLVVDTYVALSQREKSILPIQPIQCTIQLSATAGLKKVKILKSSPLWPPSVEQ